MNDTTASAIGLPSALFFTAPITVPIDGAGAFSIVRVTTTGLPERRGVERIAEAEDQVLGRQRRAVLVADRAQADVDARVDRQPLEHARAQTDRQPVLIAVLGSLG